MALRLDILTIFPDYLRVLDLSLIGKAAHDGRISVGVHDLRNWTHDRHRTVDDTPLGGGAGMVMKPDVWGEALDEVLGIEVEQSQGRCVLVIPTPSGEVFTQRVAEDLAAADHIVFACGRYEGIDSRVATHYASRGIEVRELSIGDYVLNGGEVASLVMIEAIARLQPGVLGNPESVVEESHSEAGLLEYETYTRPVCWRGLDVAQSWPALLSGDHGRIARERRDQAIARTAQRRPDMITRLRPDMLDSADRVALARCGWVMPSRAPRPVQMSLRPALAEDADAVAQLAALTFPDACPPFLSAEQIQAHIDTNLTPQRFGEWIADPRAILTLATVDERLVLDGDESQVIEAGTVVGYSLVLIDRADAEGKPPAGLDPSPACIRKALGEMEEAARGSVDDPEKGQVLAAELSKVYVSPAMRGSGLAQVLLAEAICDANTAGVTHLWLGTHEGNKRAQKAYKRAGLRKAGTRRYDVGGQLCRDVVMLTNPATHSHGGSHA